MNTKQKFLSTLAAVGLMAGVAQAQVEILYGQPFDYDSANNGSSLNTNFSSDGWLTSDTLTGFLSDFYTYDHGGGLSYSGITPSATGGAANYAGTTASSSGRYVAQDMNDSIATWDGRAAGTMIEFSGLVNVGANAGLSDSTDFGQGNVSVMNFLSSEGVNNVTFGVTSTHMFVEVNENNNQVRIMGPTYALGQTLAFYVQAIRGDDTTGDGNGTRPNAPRDSVVNIWFNPDFSDLGLPDHVATGSRIGRSTKGYANTGDIIGYDHMQLRTWQSADDVDVTWDQASMYIIPEPGTLALVGIALGSLLLFRRRKA